MWYVIAMMALVLGVVVLCNSKGKKKVVDPFDHSPLTDPVELKFITPQGASIKLKVNRRNAESYKKYGPKHFPSFMNRMSYRRSYGDFIYLWDYDEGSCFNPIDSILLFSLFFGENSNVGDADALQASWESVNPQYSVFDDMVGAATSATPLPDFGPSVAEQSGINIDPFEGINEPLHRGRFDEGTPLPDFGPNPPLIPESDFSPNSDEPLFETDDPSRPDFSPETREMVAADPEPLRNYEPPTRFEPTPSFEPSSYDHGSSHDFGSSCDSGGGGGFGD